MAITKKSALIKAAMPCPYQGLSPGCDIIELSQENLFRQNLNLHTTVTAQVKFYICNGYICNY